MVPGVPVAAVMVVAAAVAAVLVIAPLLGREARVETPA
jgi:hypothetical protein